jgi:hypothetical protein
MPQKFDSDFVMCIRIQRIVVIIPFTTIVDRMYKWYLSRGRRQEREDSGVVYVKEGVLGCVDSISVFKAFSFCEVLGLEIVLHVGEFPVEK